jgi:hypothetical protein
VLIDPHVTGAWSQHAGKVAYWDGYTWNFRAPYINEMHGVTDQNAIFTWNGLTWTLTGSLTGTFSRPQTVYVGEGPPDPVTFALPPNTHPDPAMQETQADDIYIDTLNDRVYVLK